jgi:hypothetical protein
MANTSNQKKCVRTKRALVVLEAAKLGRHRGESGIESFGRYFVSYTDQDASLELSHHKSVWSLVASLVNSKPRFDFGIY